MFTLPQTTYPDGIPRVVDLDQWLDATMPSARWSLRCNTASKQCGIRVIRYVSTALPDGWVDPDP